MGSARLKDEIFTRCRVIPGDKESRDESEASLFTIFDNKVERLIKLIIREYAIGEKISREQVDRFVYGSYNKQNDKEEDEDDYDYNDGLVVKQKEREVDIDE
jgi:hypothetical protein